ncbi:Hypothetical protein D9617_6g095990 [Elsinoe fawcettii]|nr:Hypothetical protein D9617_6g095990 [Elsinoe fawcettii]
MTLSPDASPELAPPSEDLEIDKLRKSVSLLSKANNQYATRNLSLSQKLMTATTKVRDLKERISTLEADKEDLLGTITRMEVDYGLAKIQVDFEHETEMERKEGEWKAKIEGLEGEIGREKETAERKVGRVREFYEGMLAQGTGRAAWDVKVKEGREGSEGRAMGSGL